MSNTTTNLACPVCATATTDRTAIGDYTQTYRWCPACEWTSDQRFFIVSMETLNETEHRVLATDPKDAERRVRAGEGRLVDSLAGQGNLVDVNEDEDQDEDS